MKSFLLYTLKVLAIFVIGSFILEQTYDFIFANGFIRSKHQKVQSLEEENHFEYVFLGSSRTENSIDCEVVEEISGKPCINLGISGSSLRDSYVLLKLLMEKGVTVRHVFVQVDYSYNEKDLTLTPAFKATLIPYRKNPVIREQLLKEKDGPYILNMPFYGYLKYDKVVGFREIFNQSLRKNSGKNFNNGFSPLIGNGTELYGTLPVEIADENTALSNMELLVSNRETAIHYFIAPYCSKVKNRDFALKLQEKLPEIYNYISLFDTREEFYVDCGHLNSTGAKKFTKTLIEDFLHARSSYPDQQ